MSIIGESFLSTILENVMGKVGALVLQEVCLAWDLEKDLKRLKNNLSAIKAVLQDAEEKQAQSNELKLWLERLEKFCYEAEDVLDELEYEGLRKQVVKLYGSTKTKVCRFFSSSNPLVFRFKIGHKIKELRESLDDIVAQKSKFHLVELVRPVMEHRVREMTDSYVHVSKVVGRGIDKEKITELLLRDGSLGVIPIVGIGGMGKTTFAKMLYNDDTVDKHFQLKIWLCVSEDGFDKKKFMVKMMNFFAQENISDPERMRTSIREKLNGKRFLLVLDDVWSDNRREWLELVDLLEEGGSGSKVIVTRSNKAAETVFTTPPYNLQALPDEYCLPLFKKLAFREGEEERYPNLVEIGNDIVRKCRGVPLAIMTLGTLLYAKRDEQEWVSIRDSEIWKLEQSKGDILPILKLSYDQLPSHLKPCFAICSIFPEDYVFRSRELTRFWMAHGLLQSPDGNEELEDTGLRYVKELCSRSFFQDIEDFGYYMRFKMHDLVRDLAMSVAHNECSVVKRLDGNISEGTRHLSFLDDVKDFPDIKVPNSLRTINLMAPYREETPSVPEFVVDKCISTCRRLRVLLVKGSFDVMPSSISDLKHLRHLELNSNETIKKLPDSLWKLHNLLTLDIVGLGKLEELPRDIRKLIKLRHFSFTTQQKRLPKDGLSNLKSLRSLSVLRCSQLEVLFEVEPDTAFLRWLTVWSCESLISLGLSLKCLATLETLVIFDCACLNLMEGDAIGDMEFRLRYLCLGFLWQLTTLPQWLQRSSKTLQHMRIEFCGNLSSLPEWLSNFNSLRKLEIIYCHKLLTLPEWMRHLTALESLSIPGCPTLIERCERDTGEDWHKISHIPNISYSPDNKVGVL